MRYAAVTLIVFAAFVAVGHHKVQPTQAVSYPAGWNLVAGPEGSRLLGALGPIYTLRPGDTGYEVLANTTPLHGGWGYWAYFPDGGEIDLGPGTDTQVSLASNQLTIVGNPYDDGDASINGVMLLYTYSPDTGYQQVSSIPVGSGAWAIGRTSFSINLAAPIPVTALPPVIAAPSAAAAPQSATEQGVVPSAQSSATPPSSSVVSGAIAAPEVVTTHTWYTSSNPGSVYYYCDDDPGWRELQDLVSYPTVAALLTVYPDRSLHQACRDGATGP